MTVLPNGVWTQETADATHQSSKFLASFLAEHLPKEMPVYDFGCGHGYYLGELEKAGYHCIGVEGYQLNNFKCKNVLVHDLGKPIDMLIPGTVISLEVGEHLPKSAQETFMRNVTLNCGGILIFSWAEIGQPGLGHINCRDINEVVADVESRGFKYQKDASEAMRPHFEEHVSWFRRTFMLFSKNESHG